MSDRRYSIMVIPPTAGGVKQYSIPQWLVPAGIAVAGIFLAAFLVSAGLAAYGISQSSEYSAQLAENTALQSSLLEMEGDVTELRQRLADLESMEQSVRVVFGLRELDPDERAMGTGGGVVPPEELSLSATESTFALETEIDRLLRRCAFERDNYGEILNGLIDRKDQLDHTPSIYPTVGYFSRGFGIKTDPFTGRKRMHNGIDLAANIGTPIYAPAAGRVIERRTQKDFGRMIVINHGYGVETRYGHLSKFGVKLGDQVQRDEIIGYVGNTGYSKGPHLHYEVHVDRRAINPMKYIYDKAPSQSVALASDG